jgi:hypothetical protein
MSIPRPFLRIRKYLRGRRGLGCAMVFTLWSLRPRKLHMAAQSGVGGLGTTRTLRRGWDLADTRRSSAAPLQRRGHSALSSRPKWRDRGYPSTQPRSMEPSSTHGVWQAFAAAARLRRRALQRQEGIATFPRQGKRGETEWARGW